MRQVSNKQASKNRLYVKLKREHFRKHPGCQFRYNEDGTLGHFDEKTLLACGDPNSTLHHRMGRGKYTCVPEWFMSACIPHHDWAERNKKRARELGYILYQ
jgi:hypothetical protein